MNIYTHKRRYKIAIIGLAILISILSLGYSNFLVEKLSEQERKRVELFAEATRRFAQTDNMNEDLTFVSEVITRNDNIPVILTNENDSIISHKNLNERKAVNPEYLKRRLSQMKEKHDPVIIDILNGKIERRVYYDDSTLLSMLFWFPFVQIGIFGLFILMAYMAFSASRRAEQNQVWVGMSKETAHQLGTPISSLIAWVELMKAEQKCHEYADEMQADLSRLETIVERFSKVGARPVLKPTDIDQVLANSVAYMKRRASTQIEINYIKNESDSNIVPLNKALFSWVIENVIKNAIDAIERKGTIKISVVHDKKHLNVDIEDTGKGISRTKFKRIFQPGITTKQRGWGLGLSLSKRIINDYHKGNIFVKWSEPGKGTVIRIELKRPID
ncbi:Sporulation kinase E [Salinivirga cyanobacteriivorans]|uniref:histidine kinase n=1 Tax=Salinivirga cyanobacteriivorans TaxID=1307839 RepID=A0A0S2I030_9BACT|nr:HAMP domain-containing sensor histidine kinase [Salinivirga cyanobacteriivorans]ALO15623.1 Sporulation kinase E [Salinivirga cyanobacteriivorans]